MAEQERTGGPDDRGPAGRRARTPARGRLTRLGAAGPRAEASLAPPEGAGLGLMGLIVGVLAGGAVYGLFEALDDERTPLAIALVGMAFVVTAAIAWLLLAERRALLRPLLPALAIAAVLAAPDFWLVQAGAAENIGAGGVDRFPINFWFFVARPLAAYLLIALAKATLASGLPPAYPAVFMAGLTMPLVIGGATLFAGLTLVLLYAWAGLLGSLDVATFSQYFKQSGFVLPFLGAMGGLSIALLRGQQPVLGALRYLLLLLCRILTPISAAFSATLVVVLLVKGVDGVFSYPYPGGMMLALSFVGMLIFNGVYQNGEAGAPPLWLRLSVIILIAVFPVYSTLAAQSFMLRIDEYGLTPPRIIGLAATGLACLYSIVCVAGLVSEINWRAKRWLAPVAPLNSAMAAVWVIALVALFSPLTDMWAMSARSQERLLLEGRIAPQSFDFHYLRLSLGREGEAALERLSETEGHPDAALIRERARAALAITNRFSAPNPDIDEGLSEGLSEDIPPPPRIEELPLNPDPDAQQMRY